MPGYRQHLTTGLIVYLVMFVVLQEQCSSVMSAMEWLGCALMGSLFPDIDIKSKGQQLFYTVALLLFTGLFFSDRTDLLPVVCVAVLIPPLSRHRGLFHRAWFVLLLTGGAWLGLSRQFPQHQAHLWIDALFFAAGAISHLWLDMGFIGLFRR